MNLKILCEFAGLLVTTAVGDFCSKQYVVTSGWGWFWLCVAAYNAGIVFWLFMLKRVNNLAQAGFVWGFGATVVLILISQIIFREPLTGRQWCGIVLGFVAMVLLL